MNELKIYTIVCYTGSYEEPTSIVMITTDEQRAKDICENLNKKYSEEGYVSYEVEEHEDYPVKYPKLIAEDGESIWYVTKRKPSTISLYNPGLNNDNNSFIVNIVNDNSYMEGLKYLNVVNTFGSPNNHGYNVYVMANDSTEALNKGKELINKFIIEKEGNSNDNS